MKRNLRQGDALSTILFNTVLEKVTWNIETNPIGTIFNRTRQYIARAEDVLILASSVTANYEVVTRSSSIKHWIKDK
jgi:hypothetical protein